MTEQARPSLTSRARDSWFPLLFVAVFAWLDWVLHGSIAFILIIGLPAVAIILFREKIMRLTPIGQILHSMPPSIGAVVRASPALLYFLVRARGTAGPTAIFVVLLVGAAILGMVKYGRSLDSRLSVFYKSRDRILGTRLTAFLLILFPILIGFALIHGSITDISALFGGTTESREAPTGALVFLRFVFGAALCVVYTFLLLRRRSIK